MKPIRRRTLGPLSLAFTLTSITSFPLAARGRPEDDDGPASDAVFTSSNAVDGNELLVYARGRDGSLTLSGRHATEGLGVGAGLGSQGAVTLSDDGRSLFVVNAGSDSVSMFRIAARGLHLQAVVHSGGLHPISVTERDGLVYVLNDGGAGNVAGFRLVRGELKPVPGSVLGLSVAGGAAPAQVGLSDEGDVLVVTEKNTDRLTSYPVKSAGGLGAPLVSASPGQTPFGFAFNRRNRLLVTEAHGGAAGASTVSSYRFDHSTTPRPQVVSASIGDTQAAACWVAITPSGRLAYVANTGSGSVSSYRISAAGELELAQGVAAATGAGSAPADTAISSNGRLLFVRNGGTRSISCFAIGADGSLAAVASAAELPPAAVGLAAN